MKILQAIYQFQTGGGSLQVAVDLTQAARRSGHQVDLLAREVPVSAAVGAEGFFSGNKLWDGWRLWQRLSQQRYDIIHVHDRYCSWLVRLLPLAPPSVQTNHLAYRTRRHLTRFADCVVGCSQAMDRHHAEFFGLPNRRRALIPNGVSFRVPDSASLATLRQALPDPLRHRKICISVARLSPQKGHTHLLRAIAHLPDSLRRDWCFVLAGDGELAPQLQQQARKHGLREVVFLGHTSAVPEWLALAEVFVLPSLYEGLPLALMEAMAAGLPCLATAVDGNQELLTPEHNGLLCQPADPADLSQVLERLLADAALCQRLGQQAQADYWQQWTFERTWQQYEALYHQISQSSEAYEQHIPSPN